MADGKSNAGHESEKSARRAEQDSAHAAAIDDLNAAILTALNVFMNRVSDEHLIAELGNRVGFDDVQLIANGTQMRYVVKRDPPSGRKHKARQLEGALMALSNADLWSVIKARALGSKDIKRAGENFVVIRMAV